MASDHTETACLICAPALGCFGRCLSPELGASRGRKNRAILSGNLNRILAVVAAFPTLIACDAAAPDVPKMRAGLWSQSQEVKVDAPAGARGKQAEALAGLNDALSDLSGMVADTHICVDDAIQEKTQRHRWAGYGR